MEKGILLAVIKKNLVFVICSFLSFLVLLYVVLFRDAVLYIVLQMIGWVLMPISWVFKNITDEIANKSAAKALKVVGWLSMIVGAAAYFYGTYLCLHGLMP